MEKDRYIGPSGKTDDLRKSIMKNSGSILNPFTLSDKQRANIMSALAEFIVDQKMSFNLVENSAFRNLYRTLKINYELPSRSTLVWTIKNEYEAMRLKFVLALDLFRVIFLLL